jgi:hypothetical protein
MAEYLLYMKNMRLACSGEEVFFFFHGTLPVQCLVGLSDHRWMMGIALPAEQNARLYFSSSMYRVVKEITFANNFDPEARDGGF